MGCNCASAEMIRKLYAKYGEPRSDKPKTFPQKVKKAVYTFFVYIILIPFSIFMTFYIIYKGLIKKEKINISKVLRLHNVRKQQDLSYQNQYWQ